MLRKNSESNNANSQVASGNLPPSYKDVLLTNCPPANPNPLFNTQGQTILPRNFIQNLPPLREIVSNAIYERAQDTHQQNPSAQVLGFQSYNFLSGQQNWNNGNNR